MLLRILGAISLFLGGLFLLVALLILLPFLDNFNTSLLLLSGIFGIVGWVLLSTGWQLLHPPSAVFVEGPRRRLARSAGPAETPAAGAEADEPELQPAIAPDRPVAAGSLETADVVQPQTEPERQTEPETRTAEQEPATVPPPAPERTFVSLGEPDPTRRPRRSEADEAESGARGEEDREVAAPARPETPSQDANGGRTGGLSRGRFKKRGAAVPPSRDRSDS